MRRFQKAAAVLLAVLAVASVASVSARAAVSTGGAVPTAAHRLEAGSIRFSPSDTAVPEVEDGADTQEGSVQEGSVQEGSVQEGPGRKIGLLIGGLILLLAAGYFFLLSWKRRDKN